MSIRDILGVYGPNRPEWTEEHYAQIAYAGFKWVVWRTDADPKAPERLASMGVQVIAQAKDRFNGDYYTNPESLVVYEWARVQAFCPVGTLVVLDNEPNLNPLRAGTWFAEHYARYLRAVMALWRYRDGGGRYPLLSPALAVGSDRRQGMWRSVGVENEVEADGVALHGYWQVSVDASSVQFGRPDMALPLIVGHKSVFYLEFGNTWEEFPMAVKIDHYARWLLSLPSEVKAACYFGLGLTSEWDSFNATSDLLDFFANL